MNNAVQASDQLTAAKNEQTKALAALAEAERKLSAVEERARALDPKVSPKTLTDAQSAVTLAGWHLDTATRELHRAEAAHRDAVQRDLTEKFRHDPDLDGTAHRAAVAKLEQATAKAEAEFVREWHRLDEYEQAAAREAADAGLPTAGDNGVVTDGQLFVRPGHPVSVAEGIGLAMPGKPARRRSAGSVIRALHAGEITADDFPVAQILEVRDAADVDAQGARALLGRALGTTVHPLGSWDPFDTEDGVWARIESVDVSEDAMDVVALVLSRGVPMPANLRPGSSPRTDNGVIVTSWTSQRDPISEGKFIVATISDPDAAQHRDPARVAGAVLQALNSADRDEWPENLRAALNFNLEIGASAEESEDDDMVVVRWVHFRDGVRQPGGLVLATSVVRDALVGLPVIGYGVISTVDPVDGGAGVRLTLRTSTPATDGMEVEAA